RPLADREPALVDQALLWIGRAQAGAADPAKGPAYQQALKAAADTLKRAEEKARGLAGTDPDAARRRGEALLALGEVQQRAGRPKEAGAAYVRIVEEKLLPARGEEVLARLVAAHTLAGDYAASDGLCERFRKEFPASPLLPEVLFRHAENAAFRAAAATQPDERARLNGEAARRYEEVVKRFPEFRHAGLARYGLALALFRRGEPDKARQALEAIAAAA